MVIVRIQKIVWNEFTLKHINKHCVSIEEAERVIRSDALSLEGHSGKRILVNKVGKRIISVIVKIEGNKLTVVTARDADKAERQGHYEKIKKTSKF